MSNAIATLADKSQGMTADIDMLVKNIYLYNTQSATNLLAYVMMPTCSAKHCPAYDYD